MIHYLGYNYLQKEFDTNSRNNREIERVSRSTQKVYNSHLIAHLLQQTKGTSKVTLRLQKDNLVVGSEHLSITRYHLVGRDRFSQGCPKNNIVSRILTFVVYHLYLLQRQGNSNR